MAADETEGLTFEGRTQKLIIAIHLFTMFAAHNLIFIQISVQTLLKTGIIIVICFAWTLLVADCVHAFQVEPEEEMMPDQVWSLKFEGNQTFSPMVLKEQIATESPTLWEKLRFWNKTGHPVNEVQIRKDVIRLENFYNRRGFINAEINYRLEQKGKEWKKKLVFEIEENVPVRIDDVNYVFDAKEHYQEYIEESDGFQRIRRRQPLQPGRRYQRILEPQVIGQIRDVLRNLGFAYAEVNIEARVDTSRLSASLTIECVSGPRADITEIDVQGNKTIGKDYVIKESGIQPGEQYGLDKLQEAQRELFNHHLFQFVTISIPEQPQDTTLNLQFRVREAPLRSVQTTIGFGTEELARGRLSWVHRNAFGKAHRFTASGRASFIQQSVNIDYLFPYIFNTKSSIVFSPFAEHRLEKSFELFTAGVTNSFIYQYRKNATASVSHEFTKNQELSTRSISSLPDTTVNYDLSSLQFSGYFSQGFGREQLGWVIQPYAQISGFLGFATFSFQKVSLDVRRFTKVAEGTILATRVQTGGIYNASVDSLPRNIRFFLGGTNSVRGWYRQELGPKEARFTEDSDGNTVFDEYVPVGGRAMFAFNIEIRQDLDSFIKGFGLTAFLDGGQVWRDSYGIPERPIQFGAGGGLRYRSPIGPLRIDVGYKLNPTRDDLGIFQQSESNAWDRIGIHFSLGQAF